MYLWFGFTHWNANSKRAETWHCQGLEWCLSYGRSSTDTCGLNEYVNVQRVCYTPSHSCALSLEWVGISVGYCCETGCSKIQWCKTSIHYCSPVYSPSGQFCGLGPGLLILVWLIQVSVVSWQVGWAAWSGRASLRSLKVVWLSARMAGGLGHVAPLSQQFQLVIWWSWGPRERAEVLRASWGWGLDVAHQDFHHVLLVEVSHKAEPDLQGKEMSSTYWWEEMTGLLAKVWLQGKEKDWGHFAIYPPHSGQQ